MGEEDDVDGTRALLWATLPMRLWGQPQPSGRAILDVLGTGLVSLEAFGKRLSSVVLAVEGIAGCSNPVPAAVDAVHAFADDFISRRLFGVDIKGGTNTILAHATISA